MYFVIECINKMIKNFNSCYINIRGKKYVKVMCG